MKRKLISCMLCIAFVMSMLAGCSKNSKNTDNTKDGDTVSPAVSQTKESKMDASQISGKLTFVQCEGNDKPGMIELLKEFKEAYPNVEIESSYMVNSELKKAMQINMLADSLPDILTFDSPDFAYFAANGYFMDITDELNEWGEVSNFYEGPLQSVTYNGKLYGLPWYSNNLAIFYNKDMLKAAGVEPPTTWSELEAAAAKLTSKGVYGFGMALPASEVATFQYIPWLYSAGGNISDLTSDSAVESLTFLKGLVDKGYMSKEVINWAHGDLQTAFLGHQVAMIEFGTWGLGTSLADADFEWGVVPMPKNDKTGKSVTVLGGYDIGITKNCDNMDAALAFLEFAESKKQVSAYAKSVGCVPVRKDVLDDDVWKDEKMKIFVDAMSDSVSRVNPFWPELSMNVYTSIQEAVVGNKAPEEALKEAQDLNKDYWTIAK